MKETFFQRIVRMIRQVKGLKFLVMKELGTGLVAILDDYGEWGEIELYFDPELWGLYHPEVWPDAIREDIGLGMLTVVRTTPEGPGFRGAWELSRHLKPLSGAARLRDSESPLQMLTEEKLAELSSR